MVDRERMLRLFGEEVAVHERLLRLRGAAGRPQCYRVGVVEPPLGAVGRRLARAWRQLREALFHGGW